MRHGVALLLAGNDQRVAEEDLFEIVGNERDAKQCHQPAIGSHQGAAKPDGGCGGCDQSLHSKPVVHMVMVNETRQVHVMPPSGIKRVQRW